MDITKVDGILNMYVRPQTFPLALKLCQSEAELPEKARKPLRDLGYPIPLCRAIGIARRFRWALAVGKEDQSCYYGAAGMGFVEKEPEGYTGPKLENGKYSHLLVAPIEIADFEPDVVLLYLNPAQAMRLSQSATRGAGLKVLASAVGYYDCADIVAGTMQKGECQFILAGGGDRVYGGTQDHEVIFTMPLNRVEAVLNGLEATHKMGFRYPVLTDLRYKPELPDFLKIPENA